MYLQDVMLEKFAQRQPLCEAYDEKMHFYSGVVDEIDAQPSLKDMEFARLNMEPLACSLRENARQWVSGLGKRLNDATKTKLTQLRADLEVCVTCLFPMLHMSHTHSSKTLCTCGCAIESAMVLVMCKNIVCVYIHAYKYHVYKYFSKYILCRQALRIWTDHVVNI